MKKEISISIIVIFLSFTLTPVFAQSPGGVSSGLECWLKGDAGTSTTTTAANISAWNDQSGNGRHHAQATTNFQPTYAGAGSSYLMNFNPAVRFDGVNDRLFVNGYINATTHSVHLFVVSRINAGSTTAWQTTYSVLNSAVNAIWHNRTPGNYLGGNRLANAKTDILYGLTAHILPKQTVQSRIIWNGTQRSSSNYNYTSTSATYTVGSDVNNGEDPLNGDIQEVIVYSGATNADFNAQDLIKIQSYLAVKYGISLDPAGQADYVSSQSSTIWTGSSNSGYQDNIFGIGRDDASALYQKQAFSFGDSSLAIYLGSLAGLNSLNSSNIADDNSFLLLGDNNLNGLSYNTVYQAGEIFENAALPEKINSVSQRIWKAQATTQNTWTVNFRSNKSQAARFLLVSSAASFTRGTTRIYPIINGVAENATINNGDFIRLGYHITGPGGVITNLVLWNKADSGIAATTVSTWNDISGWQNHLSQSNVLYQPVLTSGSASTNYNPAVTFSSDVLHRDQNFIPATTGAGVSIFSSARSTSIVSSYKTLWDFYSNTPTLNLRDATWTFYNGGNDHTINATAGKTNIASAQWLNRTSNSVVFEVDGTVVTKSNSVSINTSDYLLGAGNKTGNNEAWVGDIMEHAIYTSKITGDDLLKINTYLAIKYGVTMKNALTYQYKATDGTTIWNGSANSAYHNNVAGIGRDDDESLNQKQSRSVNASAAGQVTIGLGTIAATNAANNGIFNNNLSYIVWGDNNNSTTTVSVTVPNGFRLTRVWKVQNHNVNQKVRISYPKTSLNKHASQNSLSCIQARLFINSSDDFTTTDVYYNLTDLGASYEADIVFPVGVSYFTFAQITGSPANVMLPLETISSNFTSPCPEQNWRYFYKDATRQEKLAAISGLSAPEFDQLVLTITYNSTPFTANINGIYTNIMQRLTTISDNSAGTYSNLKIRIYYSEQELAQSQMPDALKQSWFKHAGDALAVLTDLLDDARIVATDLTPTGTGIENGVAFVEFSNITGFSTFGYLVSNNLTILPVSLQTFSVKPIADNVLIEWTTEYETNNAGFYIERSQDANTWTSIGWVPSKAPYGKSSRQLHYSLVDNSLVAVLYFYRVKQVDLDGSIKYSHTISLRRGNGEEFVRLSPNPAQGSVFLRTTLTVKSVMVFDVTGKNIPVDNIKLQPDLIKLNFNHVNKGQYYIKIVTQDGGIILRKLLLQ